MDSIEGSIEYTVKTFLPLVETVDDQPDLDDQVQDGGADDGEVELVEEENHPRCYRC